MSALSPAVLERVETAALAAREAFYLVAAPFRMDRARPALQGREVILDGERHLVVGVYGRRSEGPVEVGEAIGLRVRRLAS